MTDFIQARDFLITHREDYETACRGFDWPRPEQFNWALDYFDRYAEGNRRTALAIADDIGVVRLTYDELHERSNRVANYLREHVAPFRRVRRLEFADLPKTSSGKIRRVELRALEIERQASGKSGEQEYREEDVLPR